MSDCNAEINRSNKPLLFCNKVTTGFCERGKPLAVVCDVSGTVEDTEEEADVIMTFVTLGSYRCCVRSVINIFTPDYTQSTSK